MFNRNCILTLAALFGVGLVFTAAAPGQTTWYVDDDAPNDPGPGDPGISDPDEDGSAEHPFDAIQEGINAAVDGDEVVVADGTYTGYGNRDLGFWGKAITVRSENGPDNCVIDCEGSPDDWHRGFLFDSGETGSARVQGLTVTNGFVDSNTGGAIKCVSGSPSIAGCRIIGNTAEYGWGGGICCGGTTAVVNCDFVGNAAGFGGGACGWGSATFTNCTFSENTANNGGGAYFMEGVVAVNCTVSANEASHSGGIGCRDSVRIRRCEISGNMADMIGGGLACRDGAAITRCTIVGNRVWGDEYSGFGGGIYCDGDDVTITDCVIGDNTAPQGGGVYSEDVSPTVTACLLAMNWAFYGSGIRISYGAPAISNCLIVGDRSYSRGAAVDITHSDATIADCTIAGHLRGLGCSYGTSTAVNCILWGNAIESITLETGGAAIVTYSDIEGGWEGAGNIDVDPLFVDSDGPDDDPNTWQDNDYHLSGNSPCIDAGDNDGVPTWVTTDLDGRLRFAERFGTPDTGNGTAPIVDMGAYEYQCTGDLDGDGEIDLSDLAALLAQYGATTGAVYADGDLDQDGDVDLSDLAALLAVYATTCE